MIKVKFNLIQTVVLLFLVAGGSVFCEDEINPLDLIRKNNSIVDPDNKLDSINTVRMIMRTDNGNVEFLKNIKYWYKKPELRKLEIVSRKDFLIYSITPDSTWFIDKRMNVNVPTVVNMNNKDNALFNCLNAHTNLFMCKIQFDSTNETAQYIGIEELDGKKVHKILIQVKDIFSHTIITDKRMSFEKQYYYIDAVTNLIYCKEYYFALKSVKTRIKEYMVVDDIVLPKEFVTSSDLYEEKRDTDVIIDQVKFNTKIDDRFFHSK